MILVVILVGGIMAFMIVRSMCSRVFCVCEQASASLSHLDLSEYSFC